MLGNFQQSLGDLKQEKHFGKKHGVRLKEKLIYKIIMCGGSNRGQTSFITRYTTGEFEMTTPTIGSKCSNSYEAVVWPKSGELPVYVRESERGLG